mmetsp:Transcript_17785/g.45119  ORF Transcript_17785/g.45119 Transcript_17785/m.45119 type:complete len:225 (-) Transcript_17785:3224-3898(-)
MTAVARQCADAAHSGPPHTGEHPPADGGGQPRGAVPANGARGPGKLHGCGPRGRHGHDPAAHHATTHHHAAAASAPPPAAAGGRNGADAEREAGRGAEHSGRHRQQRLCQRGRVRRRGRRPGSTNARAEQRPQLRRHHAGGGRHGRPHHEAGRRDRELRGAVRGHQLPHVAGDGGRGQGARQRHRAGGGCGGAAHQEGVPRDAAGQELQHRGARRQPHRHPAQL